MESTKKRVTIYALVVSLFVLFCIISFSFAYFTANQTLNGVSVTTTVNSSYVPVMTGSCNGPLNVTVTDADMLPSAANNTTAASTTTKTCTVNLTGGSSSNDAVCTFDFVWTDKSSTAYSPSSTSPSLKEFTIKILTGSTTVLAEKQISSLTSGSAIASSSISSTGAAASKTFNITLSVYNLSGVNQTNIRNKTYLSEIAIKNASCEW